MNKFAVVLSFLVTAVMLVGLAQAVAPFYNISASSNLTEITALNTNVLFYSQWGWLLRNASGYVFEWNATGTAVNDTWVTMGVGVLGNWTNVSKIVLWNQEGKLIQYKFYVNSSDGDIESVHVNTTTGTIRCVSAYPTISSPTSSPSKVHSNTNLTFNFTCTDSWNISGVKFEIDYTGAYQNFTATQYTYNTTTAVFGYNITNEASLFTEGTTLYWRGYCDDSVVNGTVDSARSILVEPSGRVPTWEGGGNGGVVVETTTEPTTTTKPVTPKAPTIQLPVISNIGRTISSIVSSFGRTLSNFGRSISNFFSRFS